MSDAGQIRIAPHSGPQTAFLQSTAQIVIYGGAAGGGKTWGLLLEPLRNVTSNPKFAATIFRRTTVSIRRPGSIWDESVLLYGQIKGAHPTQHNLEWHFKDGGKVVFAHLEYNNTVLEWHASQLPFIGFEELTEFTAFQFWYMFSRNRSLSGVPPYIRATCNPDANSWVAELISWWINQDTGLPIPERSGKVRWFLRVGDELIWRDRPEQLVPERLGLPTHDRDGKLLPYIPKSLTFIPSDLYDNPTLMKGDPGYLANLLAMPTVERERLLKGNWKIRPSAGLYFKREWVKLIRPEKVPLHKLTIKRGWDLAATEKTQLNSPDWTCGTKIGKDDEGNYYILDHTYIQKSSSGVEVHLKLTAAGDGRQVVQYLPQDPGQAGKWQTIYLKGMLPGYAVQTSPESGDKAIRFGPFSSQAEAGKVFVVEGPWNERWFSVLEGFPDNSLDDDVDSTSRSFNAFLDSKTGLIDYYKEMAAKIQAEKLAVNEPPPKSEDEGGIRMKPPSMNVNMISDAKGNYIFAQADGCFIVSEKHADQLERAGFVRQEAEIIDLAAVMAEAS